MEKEAIILAGGFGTRLKHVLGNIPKPMAPVDGWPFLTYLLLRLEQAGYGHVVLSTGYLHETISDYYGSSFGSMALSYTVEDHPLFTGGAIAYAMQQTKAEDILVLNGDTLFDIDLAAFETFHRENGAPVSIALRQVDDTARYGSVETDEQHRITGFTEKSEEQKGAGVINGGIYMIRREWLHRLGMPEKFSFEKEVLQTRYVDCSFRALAFESYFIDIGVPEDYHRAQREFGALFRQPVFLMTDRDGVLNVYRPDDYVKCWKEWQWETGALEALRIAALRFRRICIISNQRGIAKGLFTMEDLQDIHAHMLRDVEENGGRIDGIFVCPDREGPNRKPNTGMALQAKKAFPEITFRDCVMVGDAIGDLQFGYRLGMRTAFLTRGREVPAEVADYTDLIFDNLLALVRHYDNG